MSLQTGGPDGRQIFISYRRLDNDPPPDGPNADDPKYGFVNYLLRQIRYDLVQMGVTNAILWQDRSNIAPADDFNDEIENALKSADLFLAILSQNYLTSQWCKRELTTMKSRLDMLGASAGQGRIFRADKHKIPDHEVPEPLRGIEAVLFYREDRYADNVDDYYWRGKVRYPDEYEGAVKRLSQGIYKRLKQLGFQFQPKDEPKPPELHKSPSNGRVVFVATPAGDMGPSYRSLVAELRGAGYRVTPDPDKDLGKLGEEVQSLVAAALAEAEASIHLLGTRTGGRPDGLDMDLVPMQLTAAAEEAKKRPGFERMIWAPVVLPGSSAEPGTARRDPLEVLGRFGQRLLGTDQIDNDTASRFNEFVLQHLAEKHRGVMPERRTEREIVYVRTPGNRKSALEIAKELKRVGFDPIEFARLEQELHGQNPHVVVCWGSQSKANIEDEVRAIHASLGAARRRGSKLILLLTSPSTRPKEHVLVLQMPYVDHIVDARRCNEEARQVGEMLASALGG
jgi:hypothetical protein